MAEKEVPTEEHRLDAIHADFKMVCGLGAFLLCMISGLYAYTDEKFVEVNARISSLERKIDAMDRRLNAKLDLLLERSAPRK